MKRSLIVALVLASLLFASQAHAAGWSANVRIASIEISNVNTAGTWLSFASPPFASHTCSNKSQYLIGGGPDNVSKITSAATEAFVSGRPVSVYWGGACSAGGYPVVLGLTIR